MSKFNLLKRAPSNPKPTAQKLFGVALEQLVERQGSAIPEMVHQCLKSLEKGIDTASLFNTAGKKVKVQLLKKQSEDSDLTWLGKCKDIHEVSELLRIFLLELPDPLLTFKLYDPFISIAKLENGEAKLQRIHNTMNALPAPNKVILTYLITFFRKCLEHKKNLVSPVVLGKYFGSALLHPRGDPPTQELTLVSSLFAYMVEEYPTLMKMPTKPPESPQAATAPSSAIFPQQQQQQQQQQTTQNNSASISSSASNSFSMANGTPATSTPASARSNTTSSKTPRSIASPRATSPSPQTTPRSSPTSNKPSTATTAKKPTTSSTTTTPAASTNSTPTTAAKRTSTVSSSPSVSITNRSSAQNIHQMQQQQLHSRLSQIQIIKQQREALKVEQQNQKEQKEREQQEQREQEQREKEQREKEEREKEQLEKEQKEQKEQTKEEVKKKDKSDPANRRLQRPAILRMKVNYDFDARDNTEITIKEGGMVDVISKDESGWWWGRIVNGESKVGLFPANYCEIVETFSPMTRKFSISQLNLNPKIRDLQKECGFVREDGSSSSAPSSPSHAAQEASPAVEIQASPSQDDTQLTLQTSTSSSSATISPRKKKSSQRILDLQKSMSSLKGFPGSPSDSPPQSPSVSSPPRSPTSPSASLSPASSFGNKLSPSSSFSKGSEGNRLTPSQSFTKHSPTSAEGNRLTPSQSFTKSPSGSGGGESLRMVKSTSFGKGATAASEGYKLRTSPSFSKDEDRNKLVPSNSFSKTSKAENGLVPSNSFSKKDKRKLKTRQERKSQSIEELQHMMQNMRGFPSTPEAVRQRQSRESEPSFALQKSTSKSRVPSSRITENGNERFSPNARVMDKLNFEDEQEEIERPSTPLNHLTKKRAKPTKRRPASIGSLRKVSQSVRTLETAEAVQETLQLLDEEVQKRQEMEALAHNFKKEYEEEKKLRNQLEDENIHSSNLFDTIKEELEQQNHTVNMLRYEKDALESMTRQLKREAMDAVNKYEEIQVSKNSLLKELEDMRRRMDEVMSERDAMERERDRYKREAAGLNEDMKAFESRSRLDKSNTLEELSLAQKQALDSQAQVITHQKAKAEVQSKLDQALKELELARDREAKFASSVQGERSELERLRNSEIERLSTMKHLEEQKAALEAKANSLKESCKEEQILRKKYFNMLEDMKGKIRVMCRTRPISDKEISSGQKMACEFVDPYSLTVSASNQTKSFNFDRVFEPSTSQEEVFSDTSHLVQSALDGYNVCIFAYGQTGSGKTHTLLGTDTLPGLCPRAMTHLFECVKRDEGRFKVSIRCYLLELYNDNLVDLLLKKDEKPAKLVIKKDSKGMVYVENVTLRKASTAEKLKAFLHQGLKHRHTGATKMNDQSSRSHLIFSMLIKSKNLQTKQHSVGKLSFVDLAGSERAARSGATDERLKEAMSINKSLSALGNVINALSTGEAFVPYRNNKLTQLMSDSIGGNAKTLMMVNVAPGDANADESLQSLAYGQRAKLITNTATKMVESAEVQRLKKIIAQLKSEKGEAIEQDEVLDVASEPNGADEDPQSSEDE